MSNGFIFRVKVEIRNNRLIECKAKYLQLKFLP